ncbi:MAG: cyclic lactone autoinducer peptide [Lachnospiraceae bacterium]|nr:cyclic lactone autoinducer peptide [Lachnospiraceae bacterium]
MDKNLKKIITKYIVKASYKEAERNANSACVFLHGQPKMPECVKKMNKINQ